jgi:hypothetical protein
MENKTLEVGVLMGQRQAFGLMAGFCSADEAENLRRIRDGRLYDAVAANWDQFCTVYLRSSRRSIDRIIALLDEFGPAFFKISQLVHIGPEEYRLIAQHFGEDGLHLDGEVVDLVPETIAQVVSATSELLLRARPPAAVSRVPTVADALRRCESAARILDRLEEDFSTEEKIALAEVLNRIRTLAARHGVMILC